MNNREMYLLAKEKYASVGVDIEKVMDELAKNKKIIEMNSRIITLLVF